MERGDIDNGVAPRILIVWENLLGLVPAKTDQAKLTTYLRLHRWKRAAQLFQINEPLAARIWYVQWKLRYSVDVVTYIGPEFRDALEERLADEDLPIGHVRYEQPHKLARHLAYEPATAAVYDPDPSHRFTYGSKGRIVSAADPDIVGSL